MSLSSTTTEEERWWIWRTKWGWCRVQEGCHDQWLPEWTALPFSTPNFFILYGSGCIKEMSLSTPLITVFTFFNLQRPHSTCLLEKHHPFYGSLNLSEVLQSSKPLVLDILIKTSFTSSSAITQPILSCGLHILYSWLLPFATVANRLNDIRQC